jgi:rfaE bifunctional protein kinase chain/domain
MLTTEMVNRLFTSFDNTKVLVIGDVMLDAYVWGSVDRISPEAPVPIVAVEKNENRLGGAANVALNLASLGANPVLCSVVGNDTRGNDFIGLLKAGNMSTAGIVQSNGRKTTTKFRIIGNNTQLLRVDDETTDDLTSDDQTALKSRINKILDNEPVRIIIFQDYDKGIISADLINYTVELAKTKNIPVAVDPKKRNFLSYKNVTLFKPNLKEIQDGLNISASGKNLDSVDKAVSQLQELLQANIVMNTLSEYGVYTRWRENDNFESSHHVAHIRNIADVSGAGDTVISVASLCLAEGLEPGDMTAIANLAGGLVCEKVGVVPIDKNKLQEEVIKMLTF